MQNRILGCKDLQVTGICTIWILDTGYMEILNTGYHGNTRIQIWILDTGYMEILNTGYHGNTRIQILILDTGYMEILNTENYRKYLENLQ